MVRRGEWNKSFLIHSIANGAPAFLHEATMAFGHRIIRFVFARLGVVRLRHQDIAFAGVQASIKAASAHVVNFEIPSLGASEFSW